MKAVAINGSPRKGGNTEILLREVLKPLDQAGWETKLIQVGGAKIKGCKACFQCFEKKDLRCSVKSDVFNAVLEEMLSAQAVILGSPTYVADMTAEMKALVDRAGLVSLANNTALSGKIGAAVVAVRRGGATHVFDSINHLFLVNAMIVPGSSYWNIGYGLNPGDVKGDAEAMRNMNHLGLAIAWLGQAVAACPDGYPKPVPA